jgi:hypothetical protein
LPDAAERENDTEKISNGCIQTSPQTL